MKQKGIVGIILLVVVVLGFMGFVLFRVFKAETTDPNQTKTEQTAERKTLNAAAYVEIQNNVSLPNLQTSDEEITILSNEAADEHIFQVAEQRGYKRRQIPSGSLVDADEVTLQEPAAQAWAQMKAAAEADGISLVIFSGYRSIDTQKAIFANQLSEQAKAKIGRSFTASEIAAGEADEVLNQIMAEYSVPGYSKHHTGYTIDIHDFGSPVDFNQFGTTEGYKWVSKNNFENVRKFGFVPSYPEGGPPQGPNPEPWEYVYVGLDALEGYQLP